MRRSAERMIVPSTDRCLKTFLADRCDATKAKYAAEMEHANGEWQKPLDLWYADSLEFFGLLERKVTTLYRGAHVRGSRTEFRKRTECSMALSAPAHPQTEFAL